MSRAATFSWRLLTSTELTRVYLDEMRRDFPRTELKPLSMILNGEASGAGHTWGVFDGDTLAAYLVMVRPEGCRASLLDYFAVVPAYRASGIGTDLLAALPAHEQDAEVILIEAELPDRAEDSAMAERRLGFYARCGALDTDWTEYFIEAWFCILALPRAGQGVDVDRAIEALRECYSSVISPAEMEKYIHFYPPHSAEAQE